MACASGHRSRRRDRSDLRAAAIGATARALAHLGSAIAICVLLSAATPPLRLSVLVQLTFEAAADRVKTLKDKPSNDVLLQIYALYKQATVGDCTGSQPWAVQVEARAKFDAWAAQKGQPQSQQRHSSQQRAHLVVSIVAAIVVRLHLGGRVANMLSLPCNGCAATAIPSRLQSNARRFRSSLVSPLTPLRHVHSLAIAVPDCSGKSQDAAKAEYIALVEALAANEA